MEIKKDEMRTLTLTPIIKTQGLYSHNTLSLTGSSNSLHHQNVFGGLSPETVRDCASGDISGLSEGEGYWHYDVDDNYNDKFNNDEEAMQCKLETKFNNFNKGVRSVMLIDEKEGDEEEKEGRDLDEDMDEDMSLSLQDIVCHELNFYQ
jgi:hypothetical protein